MNQPAKTATTAVATTEKAAEPNIPTFMVALAESYGMTPQRFNKTVKATCKMDKATDDQFVAFIAIAHRYNLNPLTKEIWAYPNRDGGITPIVSIDGWIKLANDHKAFDGMDFVDHTDKEGKIVAITCKIHRKDRNHPIEVTEYLEECKRPTEPWKQMPRRMLRHKSTIQAVRYAFGFSGIYDEDEAARIAENLGEDPAAVRAAARAIAASHMVEASSDEVEVDNTLQPSTDDEENNEDGDNSDAPQS